MRYGSVCSGVEAASVAWEPLGFEPVFFSEIEPFPAAVLAHHWPDVPNLGDMTNFELWDDHEIDILVGGTPCQSFSIAGLKKGLSDARGNLSLTYMHMVDRYHPRWTVWENVPGVLSSGGGRDFGSIVGALAELGYSCAWRVLDAQNFGVPQRRRRVFLVGCSSGDWRDPAKVLFESGCGGRDFEQSREAREEVTGSLGKGTPFDMQRISQFGGGRVASTVMHRDYKSATDLVVHSSKVAPTITSSGPPYSRTGNQGSECDALVVHGSQDPIVSDKAHAIGRNQGQENVVYNLSPGKGEKKDDIHVTYAKVSKKLDASGSSPAMHQGGAAVISSSKVRRLTPTEAERLQGFPDGHTDIGWKGKPTPDSHRYKAMGNSMAVPVMRWIGQRIKEHDQ